MTEDLSLCEAWWTKCEQPYTKLAVFDNSAGELVTVRFCADHAEQLSDEDFRRGLVDGALDTLGVLRDSGLSRRPMRELLRHPAQRALAAHQRSCDRCREVRDWISREQARGRIRSEADITRVGEYVIANSCKEGVELNHALGLAMQGR